jgi:hypothetical protein
VKDPLAIGLGALAAGVGLGGATLTLAQGIVAVLRERVDPTYWRYIGDDPLWTGVVAGLALGAFFGWVRSGPIDNLWQRGVIAVLAAVGALLVGFLAAVAHGLGGAAGLVVWGGASVALGVLGSRWAIKGTRAMQDKRVAGSGL